MAMTLTQDDIDAIAAAILVGGWHSDGAGRLANATAVAAAKH